MRQLNSGIPCIEISQLLSSQSPKAVKLASDPFLSARGTPVAWMMNGEAPTLHPPPPPHVFLQGSCLKEPSQRNSSLGQRKAPSPHSKCSFQTSLPLVGMLQWLLGVPPLTLGNCQESSRHGSLPPSFLLSTFLLLSAHCPGSPVRLSFQCLNQLPPTKPSCPGLPWQL